MRGPTFLNGVLVALVLAFVTSAAIATLVPFVGLGSVVRILIPVVTLAYILYLVRMSHERLGNIATISVWSVLAVATWWIAPPLPLYVLIHVGSIWLVRSLYFYSGVVPALADMLLSALAIAGFIWAISRTGSVFIATWAFFLVQSLFVAIPRSIKSRHDRPATAGNGKFEQARRQADRALKALANQ